MSKIRAFTYNNGSAIGDNSQLGNLAIGRLGQRYDNQPGGKIWWGSPDEDLTYYIAKDVPTEDHSTPVGDIGSVIFWGFPRATAGSGPFSQDEEDFIRFSNRIAGTSFANDREAGEWLYNSGYYTNYPYGVAEWDYITGYATPSSLIFGLTYGSTNEELYFYNNSSVVGEYNGVSVATAEYNGGNGGQDYSYSGSLPSTGSNDYNLYLSDITIDNTGNYLYASTAQYQGGIHQLIKYNLSNKTLTHSTSSNSTTWNQLSLDTARDRLYNYRSSTTTGYEIRMYTASTLDYFGSITGPNNLSVGLGLSTNPEGDLLVVTKNNIIKYQAADIHGDYAGNDSKTSTYSFTSNGYVLGSSISTLFKHQIAYVPSENAWFFRANTSPTSSPANKARVFKYTTDGQLSILELGTNDGTTGTNKLNLIYDPARDLLWTMQGLGTLIGVNPSNLNIEVSKKLNTAPSSGYGWENLQLALDETNGILFTVSYNDQNFDDQILVWDLQEFYPI